MLENGTFTLNISIPATVYVPTSAKDEVTEGGVVFEVEAGTYDTAFSSLFEGNRKYA